MKSSVPERAEAEIQNAVEYMIDDEPEIWDRCETIDDFWNEIYDVITNEKVVIQGLDENLEKSVKMAKENKEIDEIKNIIDEAEDEEGDENSENAENNEVEKEESSFHADSLDDFVSKTKTAVKITKMGSEPSPIFGPNDTNNHNKYKITITNDNGSCWYIFWDSIYNTKNNIPCSTEDAIIAFARDAQAAESVQSLEDFIAEFGYDNADRTKAQKSYDGCRRMRERLDKMFTKEEQRELFRLVDAL